MPAKKQASVPRTRVARFGRWAGRNLPGAAKRLGRATKTAARETKNLGKTFAENFKEGYKEC